MYSGYEIYERLCDMALWYERAARAIEKGDGAPDDSPMPYREGATDEENKIFWRGAAFELRQSAEMFYNT